MWDKLSALNQFLERIKTLIQQWDYHATTCKQCATWDTNHKGQPCEVGMALVHEILDMLDGSQHKPV